MIETINFKGSVYPKFQSEGFAAQFAFPYARKVCIGEGLDIGCNRPEWAYVDKDGKPAIMIDPVINPDFDAYNLPKEKYDYIFSSHCLEHLSNWADALDYWATKLKRQGTLFLYLPAFSQRYWRPWSNRKHIHILTPEFLKSYLEESGFWHNIFVGERDLNDSFMVMAQRKDPLNY